MGATAGSDFLAVLGGSGIVSKEHHSHIRSISVK